MPEIIVPSELIGHLCRSSRLTEQEAEHIASEVLAYFSQTPDDFLRSRHQELQAIGNSNEQIYVTLQQELKARRFIARPMSTRQIRRAIYG